MSEKSLQNRLGTLTASEYVIKTMYAESDMYDSVSAEPDQRIQAQTTKRVLETLFGKENCEFSESEWNEIFTEEKDNE